MEITKNDVNSYFYFLEPINGTFVLQYGKLISVLPKYMFLDRFNSEYSREKTYLFEVENMHGVIVNKSMTDSNYIFKTFNDFNNRINDAFFGYSVLLKEKGVK